MGVSSIDGVGVGMPLATHTAVTDGLTAAKWAYILCELGPEGAVTRWIEYFEKIT